MTLVIPLLLLAAGVAVIVNTVMMIGNPSHPSLRFRVKSSWNRRVFSLSAGGAIALFGLTLLLLDQLRTS